MTKLKEKIAITLLLSLITVGSISINVNIDSKKFWSQAERGELYVTSFNMKQYKLLRADLVNQMDEYFLGEHFLTYQALQVHLKILTREAGKDSFEKMVEVDKEVDGKIIKVQEKRKFKGWFLENITPENTYLMEANKRLKTKIK